MMGADDAALMGLAAGNDRWVVKVSEPVESDTGEFGEPDGLDEETFPLYAEARSFCELTARRGLRAVMYHHAQFVDEFE